MTWIRNILSALLVAVLPFAKNGAQLLTDTQNLPPKYEMRGVWVGTIVNLNWPSRKGLSVEQQKAEFVQLAEAQRNLGINALFVQIRPAGDAFYPSQYDPWSEYLTGVQGQAPQPFYDPLKFMIETTHRFGMEFHAWINPYRMVMNIGTSSVTPNHITKLHPEWFVTYGRQKIFNPGLPEAIKYITGVVRDVINRYDLDGIHMDDYFYPYPEHGVFHDEDAYRKYGNGMSLDDWRRSNCDSLIKSLHDAILADNPMVKFGISPFGIYRNKSASYPDGSQTNGSQAYSDLYADILLWLRNGWIDYVVPQLYWEIGHNKGDFTTLINWWAQHTYGKHLYIGEAIDRVKNWKDAGEFPKHLRLARGLGDKVQGEVLFSSKEVLANYKGVADSLADYYYRKPALVPPMPWINDVVPESPEIWAEVKNNNFTVNCYMAPSKSQEEIKSYIYYYALTPDQLGKSPDFVLSDSSNFSSNSIPTYTLPENCKEFYVAVTSLDRENNESDLSNMIVCRKVGGVWKVQMGY